MKIAILVPFYKTLPADSCKCLIDLSILLRGYGVSYSFISISDTYLHDARERLFELFEKERAKSGDYDFILHIDSDQTFKVEDAANLLRHAEENDFPILSGVYFSPKGDKILPVLLNRVDGEIRKKIAEEKKCKESDIKEEYCRMYRLPKEPFFEIDACGFGFMVCKPKVYDDIKAKFGKPIFVPKVEREGNRLKGEDVVWCEKAKACGYKIRADRSVIIGHKGWEIGYREYKASLLAMYLANKQKNEPPPKEPK